MHYRRWNSRSPERGLSSERRFVGEDRCQTHFEARAYLSGAHVQHEPIDGAWR